MRATGLLSDVISADLGLHSATRSGATSAAMTRMMLLCALILHAAAGWHATLHARTSHHSPSATSTASAFFTARATPPAMAARSKEAEANIKKWGKILSQADTFDDKIKLKKGAAVKKDKTAGGTLIVIGTLGAVVAMLAASVQG